jgi:hypothetical protein
MKKWFMAMCFVLAMLLGACGGPGIGDGTQTGPDGNQVDKKITKSFAVVYKESQGTPLVLWNATVMAKQVTIGPEETKSVELTKAKSSIQVYYKAAYPGYIHPAELNSIAGSVTAVSGKTAIITGKPIPWLFESRGFGGNQKILGRLVDAKSLESASWNGSEYSTSGTDLYLNAMKGDPFTIHAFTPDGKLQVKFRWNGTKYEPLTTNLGSIYVRYLMGPDVPKDFRSLFSNIPTGAIGNFRDVSGDATWEVTLEGTDKQGRPFKKSYYALVAKPY